jgi:hypothetical protein
MMSERALAVDPTMVALAGYRTRRWIIRSMPPEDDIKRGPGMKPMFLPDVERNSEPSAYNAIIRMMRDNGQEYPQIWHMFAFLPKATEHLARFTQEILRGPAPLSPGIRELIAAYTSSRNHCPF